MKNRKHGQVSFLIEEASILDFAEVEFCKISINFL